MTRRGDTDGIDPGLRLGWIVVVADCLVTATLVNNLRSRILNARLVEYSRKARAPRPATSNDAGTLSPEEARA
ncbi:hypothetical protein [Nonomuraea sp. NPDC049141]|uniref:hypothetical protein n=1 Tax=unclassified Nonomuraea TaxID=2593643 RepID=UPI003408111C